MGVTLPLTAEGQKREKTMAEIKKLRIEGTNWGKSYGSERRKSATGDRHIREWEESKGTRREISRLPEVSGTAPVSPV